jgi:hypothetical protein
MKTLREQASSDRSKSPLVSRLKGLKSKNSGKYLSQM